MYDVYVYSFRTTNEQLMLSALVPFQITELTKSFIADYCIRTFLVRVNTHVPFQATRFTKTPLAHIAFIRFLVRVNTHVGFQMTRFTENTSRTHHTRTVSRLCEYACALSNYQNHEKLYHKNRTRTVSRSCECACVYFKPLE